MDGYNRRFLINEKKGIQNLGKIEDVLDKTHARAKKVL